MPKAFVPAGSVANIRRTLESATPSQIQRGMRWYREFSAACLESAAKAGFLAGRNATRRQTIIGIAAAFSIQRSPNCNLATLHRFVVDMLAGYSKPQRGKCWHTPQQDAKALAIWNGTDPSDALTGPKESAFYANILGDPEHVTVDGHAYAIWTGQRITTNKISVPSKGPQRAACIEDYRSVAAEYGITPSDVQAITWVSWRDTHQTDKEKARRSFGGDWFAD